MGLLAFCTALKVMGNWAVGAAIAGTTVADLILAIFSCGCLHLVG